MAGRLNDEALRNKKRTSQDTWPRDREEKYNSSEYERKRISSHSAPRMVYQDEVISGNYEYIIIQKKVFNRKYLNLRNRKPYLTGSTNLHLVAATLKNSVVITNYLLIIKY